MIIPMNKTRKVAWHKHLKTARDEKTKRQAEAKVGKK